MKRTKLQAENDARTILTVYGIREKDGESGTAGIFGFRTWWLSNDTTTHRAVKTCLRDNRLVSCYLRPDFLLNYIALAARGANATKVFDQMFPTLVGVSLSHHVSDELSHGVHEAIKAHRDLSPARVKAIIGSLATQLMTEAGKGKATLRKVLDNAFVEAGSKKAQGRPQQRNHP